MSDVLKEFPRRGRTAAPWEKWMDGRVHKLVIGVDVFTSVATRPVQAVQSAAYMAAKLRGLRLRTASADGGKAVIIQAYNRDGSPIPAPRVPAKVLP